MGNLKARTSRVHALQALEGSPFASPRDARRRVGAHRNYKKLRKVLLSASVAEGNGASTAPAAVYPQLEGDFARRGSESPPVGACPGELCVPSGDVVDVRRPAGNNWLSPAEYLRRTLLAQVYDVADETPLELAPRISERLEGNNEVLLKREDLQPVFSFKLRGAYNKMRQLPPEQLERGVICSSAGNHAQGVALGSSRLGCDGVICMPNGTPRIKYDAVSRLGGTVEMVGETYDETQSHARQRMESEGRAFIPPFDDPDVISGQGTVGMEIMTQASGQLDAIFVPIGGGGLAAGIAAYVKSLRPEIRVIGVEPAGANAMAQSLYRGNLVSLSQVDKFAEGVAVSNPGKLTYAMCQELIDGVVLVDTDEICAAIKDMFEETRSVLEPAGAVSLAGLKAFISSSGWESSRCVAISSGANMNFDRLRVVSELAELGLQSEAVLATSIPEKPGAFKRFVQSVGPSINITEFKYRADMARDDAFVLFSVSYRKSEELTALKERMKDAKMPTTDLSNDEVTKVHLRELVGGRSSGLSDEVLYQFEFPDKPGALSRFLEAVSPEWNITLFHYRNAGTREASVLVGFEVPWAQRGEFHAVLDGVGYPYSDKSGSFAFKAFCR